jgi:hypothetical protein
MSPKNTSLRKTLRYSSIGLFKALLKTSQQPSPDALKTAIADRATGVARAKIKNINPHHQRLEG